MREKRIRALEDLVDSQELAIDALKQALAATQLALNILQKQRAELGYQHPIWTNSPNPPNIFTSPNTSPYTITGIQSPKDDYALYPNTLGASGSGQMGIAGTYTNTNDAKTDWIAQYAEFANTSKALQSSNEQLSKALNSPPNSLTNVPF